MLDTLRQDVRYALRGIRAHPGFAAAVSLTIALGVGANATMFGIVDRLLFRSPPGVRDADRVVQVATRLAGWDFWNSSLSYPEYLDLRDGVPGFSSVAMSYPATLPLDRGASASSAPGALVSGSFFRTLRLQPQLGRFFSAADDDSRNPQMVAVISYGFWQKQFGGRPDVLGSRLSIGTQQYTVIGVAQKGVTGIDLTDVAVWLPITAPSGLRFDNAPGWERNRGATWLNVIARLKDGVSVQLAAEQATAADRAGRRQWAAELPPDRAKNVLRDSETVLLAPLIPGGEAGTIGSTSIKVSRMLVIVSFIVLGIACANVANLLLVRGYRRRREIAIRLALGVSRARLMSQLLIEGLLLATIGGVGALLVAHWTSQSVRALLLGSSAWSGEAVDGRMLAFTAAMTLAGGLLSALAPALQATRTNLNDGLKEGVREGGGQGSPLRAGLLILQAALAIVLLTGAGAFIRSVENINHRPFGIDLDHVLVASISHASVGLTNAQALALYRQFADRARAMPGVQSTAVTLGLPFGLSWSANAALSNGRKPPQTRQNAVQYAVTADYFSTMGIGLVAGRRFTPQDRAGGAPVAAVNETMAQMYWPNQDAVGQCLKFGGDTMPCATVVGVVTNTVRQGFQEGIVPQAYRPLDQVSAAETDRVVSYFGYYMVLRSTRDAALLVQPVRQAMQSVSSLVPFATVRPMRDLLSSRMRPWNMGEKVFVALGVLALVLATIGLYSVLAFSIAQRLHEFGVRVALGARAADLVRLTVSVGLAPIIGGIVCGVLLAFLLGKFIASLLFNVSPHDPTILASVCAILLLTATLASLIPALRATKVDPARVLRAD